MPNPVTCQPSQFGPIVVWENENLATSCFPSTGCKTKEVCLDDITLKNGSEYAASEFRIKSEFPVTSIHGLPFAESPFIPTTTFTLNNVAYSLKTFIQYLDSINAFPVPLKDMFLKTPFDIMVGNVMNMPVAAFLDQEYALVFGYFPPVCALGSDRDVVLHEFTHLLIYTLNQILGTSPADLEGPAIHEAIADVIPAILHNNPFIGEGVTACFDANDRPAPNKGIRRLNDPQLELINPEECHGRSTLYSTLLWFTFENIKDLLKKKLNDETKGLEAAKALSISIFLNAVRYLPSPPAKRDIVRALRLSALELEGRLGFCKNLGVGFKDIQNIIVARGKSRGLIKESDVAWVMSDPKTISGEAKSMELKKRSLNGVNFEPVPSKNGVEQFVQYYKGFPVVAAGISFVVTPSGYIMIDNSVTIEPVDLKIKISAKKAMELLKAFPSKDLRGLLEKNYSGNMSSYDINNTLTLAENSEWGKKANPILVFSADKSTPQYMVSTRHANYFIDAVSGEISISRASY